jgi:DNA helicase II / ATP-dependent DNA helicase PcrA
MDVHAAVAQRLERLAPDQRAAATAPPGPVLCVAPAGSGKTTTLVARVAWLVATGTRPEHITAVTFNKRAADELGERLKTALAPLVAEADRHPRVRTFHALGREILSDAGHGVANLVDRAAVLRRLNGGQQLPAGVARTLDDAFSRLKLDLCLTADELRQPPTGASAPPVEARVAAAFIEYERWLVDNDALDFDDLVRRALGVLRANPVALATWRERCATLLVDEVQDVDRSQLELALLLAGPQRNVFLVGDDDQTIYAWRLADVRRVLELAGALPGLRRVDLVTNYRCPRPVVERAVRLIERNAERFSKSIQAGPLAEGQLHLLPDSGDELARARRLLCEWYRRYGDSGTYAVLARTNAELAPFAAVALEMGFAYRAADDGLLLDEPGISELLGGLPDGERPAIVLARNHDRSRLARALTAWAVGYGSATELRQAIGIARAHRAELRRDDAQLVLATAHGTKGLEFDHVACIGLDENVFPSRRTIEEHADPARAMEEERRLAYVAWTRARRSLVLVYDPSAPSPFMRDAFTDDELALSRSA